VLNNLDVAEVECGLGDAKFERAVYLAWSERFQIRRDADADLSEEKLNV